MGATESYDEKCSIIRDRSETKWDKTYRFFLYQVIVKRAHLDTNSLFGISKRRSHVLHLETSFQAYAPSDYKI